MSPLPFPVPTANTPMAPPDDLEFHKRFMRSALEMAETALRTDEVPVGCVFVHNNQIIGRGMNDTNRSLCVRSSATATCCTR